MGVKKSGEVSSNQAEVLPCVIDPLGLRSPTRCSGAGLRGVISIEPAHSDFLQSNKTEKSCRPKADSVMRAERAYVRNCEPEGLTPHFLFKGSGTVGLVVAQNYPQVFCSCSKIHSALTH